MEIKEINNLTIWSDCNSIQIGVTNFSNILGGDITYKSGFLDKEEIKELVRTLQSIDINLKT